MGVKLKDLVVKKETSFKKLSGRKLAVDAYNIIYQFLSTIRQRDGTLLKDEEGRVTSHLSGLFYRNARILQHGIKPCFVFDGKPPEFKAVAEQRAERKRRAKKKLEEAREEGDEELMMRYAQQTSKLTPSMIKESKKLLRAMGIPVVQAPSEGEAQCARMVQDDIVWAVLSRDYDCLLFGADRLVRNLNVTGRRKIPGKQAYYTIKPEVIRLKETLEELGLSREQLITLAILVGTDYNPKGIKGIGPKRGLKKVLNKTWEEIFEEVEWKFDVTPESIRDFFLNPKTNEASPEWKGFDANEIRGLLCEKHGFSEKRVGNALKRIELAEQKREQGSLNEWI